MNSSILNMNLYRILLLALLLSASNFQAKAAVVTLYDGSGLPASQPWLVYADDGLLFGGSAVETAVPGGVNLTTDNTVRAGYSNYGISLLGANLKNSAFPILDRSTGFELSFTAQLMSEAHVSPDRAGFSVILLGSDSRGIELGFWQGEIWAQTSPGFTHGVSTALDTTVERTYGLRIAGDSYTLLADGTPVLNGTVENYPGALPLPYQLSNFLFLGDDTTSAAANVSLGAIRLETNLSAVPEPGSLMLVGALVVCAAFNRRKPRWAG